MLIRMKLMIKHDFTTYLKLLLIFMLFGSIALNAVLYQYYPFNLELMKRVILTRGFMTLFASDKQDLERNSCNYKSKDQREQEQEETRTEKDQIIVSYSFIVFSFYKNFILIIE